jgi:hypothetical protein
MKMKIKMKIHTMMTAAALATAAPGCMISDDAVDDPELGTTAQEMVGGTAAPNANYPWVVWVQGDLGCHGTLISSRWVLTAAHCVDQAFESATVSYSRTNPSTGVTTTGSRVVLRSGMVIHPEWDEFLLVNDLALLRLPTAFAADPLLQYADLPIAWSDTGEAVVVASGQPSPGQVNVMAATVTSGGPGDNHLLVRGDPARVCTGDSGSGVIRQLGGVNYVVGVVSNAPLGGTDCGIPDAPFSAMGVAAYAEWIAQSMQSGQPAFDGGFTASVLPYPVGYFFGLPSPYETLVGDFDGDGRKDYLRVGGTAAYAFYGASGAAFTHVYQPYPGLDFGMPSTWTTRVGDFNGDNRDDYIRLGNTGLWCFWGTASKTFTTSFIAYSGLDFGQPTTWDTGIGDFNGDGRDDYARIGGTGSWVFFGNANKTFTQTFHAYAGLDFGQPSLWQLAIGDFNGDGRGDYLRIGNTGAWLYRGNTNKTFTQSFHAYASGWDFGWPSPYELIVGDFNGDGRTDYRRLSGTGAYTFRGTSTPSFTQSFQSFDGADFGMPSAWTTLVADFNNDNRDDFVRLGDTAGYLYYGTSTATFTSGFWDFERHYGLPSPFSSIAGDWNGDGKDDVARLGNIYPVIYYRD